MPVPSDSGPSFSPKRVTTQGRPYQRNNRIRSHTNGGRWHGHFRETIDYSYLVSGFSGSQTSPGRRNHSYLGLPNMCLSDHVLTGNAATCDEIHVIQSPARSADQLHLCWPICSRAGHVHQPDERYRYNPPVQPFSGGSGHPVLHCSRRRKPSGCSE